jgi:ribosomal protein S27E
VENVCEIVYGYKFAKNESPSIDVTCERCSSNKVIIRNTLMWKRKEGFVGALIFVCLQCDNQQVMFGNKL